MTMLSDEGIAVRPLTPAQRLYASMMPEEELLSLVLALAAALGYWAYHPFDSRRSAHGWPDLALAHPSGRFLLAELKSRDGRLTPAQSATIALLRVCGLEVYLWRPADWLDGSIERVLRGETTHDGR